MLEVIFTSQAELDFAEAIEFYAERSVDAAEHYQTAIEDATSIIRKDPLVWEKVDARHRRYRIRKFPFSIYYHVTATSILIVAISHAKRRPFYWRQ